jgi:hypothetical protein
MLLKTLLVILTLTAVIQTIVQIKRLKLEQRSLTPSSKRQKSRLGKSLDNENTHELGQFRPPDGTIGPPADLTREELEWAYEQGADDEAEATDMIKGQVNV